MKSVPNPAHVLDVVLRLCFNRASLAARPRHGIGNETL